MGRATFERATVGLKVQREEPLLEEIEIAELRLDRGEVAEDEVASSRPFRELRRLGSRQLLAFEHT
jgi:hypothetical protein